MPNASEGPEPSVSFTRRAWYLVAVVASLLALGAWLYAMGLHAAVPRVTLLPGVRADSQPRRLIVFVKGVGADVESYAPLIARLRREPQLAGSDVLVFDHRLRRLSMSRAADVSTRLRAEIDAQWIRSGGYDDVILAGHSTGSLLVRKAYLASAGRDAMQPRTVPWADHVSRIVMLSGIGRGVDAEEHGAWSWVLATGRFVPLLRRSVMYDVLRGSAFVTNVRIQWITHFSSLEREGKAAPMVVQLLGTEDEVIKRDDNIDFEQYPNAFQIDVPGAHHRTIQRLDEERDPEPRYRLIREAFVAATFPNAVPRHVLRDSVERVVILLHGIRSSRNGWVRDLAPQLRARLAHVEVVESSYGYISILEFALPSVRRRQLRWLQDRYTELLARHPNARFDVVAHSNGAYLLGESLSQVPAMRFDHVLLLGSVLPAEYPWRERFALGQVQYLRSDRAADDAVVALWCSALHGVGMMDVGTSGWRGFDDTGPSQMEVSWAKGGHSAALTSANLAGLTEFLATGEILPTVGQIATAPARSFARLSRLAPWIAWIAICALALGSLHWLRVRPAALSRRAVGVAVVVVAIAALLDAL